MIHGSIEKQMLPLQDMDMSCNLMLLPPVLPVPLYYNTLCFIAKNSFIVQGKFYYSMTMKGCSVLSYYLIVLFQSFQFLLEAAFSMIIVLQYYHSRPVLGRFFMDCNIIMLFCFIIVTFLTILWAVFHSLQYCRIVILSFCGLGRCFVLYCKISGLSVVLYCKIGFLVFFCTMNCILL